MKTLTLFTIIEEFSLIGLQLQIAVHLQFLFRKQLFIRYNYYHFQSVSHISKLYFKVYIQRLYLTQFSTQNTQALQKIISSKNMNHREVGLHNIIKQQESKISQLKQQLALVTQLSQSRILDLQKMLGEQLIQKENVIVYLNQQLQRQRMKTRIQDNVLIQNSTIKVQVEEYDIELKKYKEKLEKIQKRTRQMEIKLQKSTEDYQIKVNNLLRDNKRLYQQVNDSSASKHLVEQQIDKLTKFYKSAMFQIPKRKQTLLWVDNLIKFMEVSEANSQRKYGQTLEFVKNNLSQLKTQLLKSISQVAILQQKITHQNDKIYEQIKNLLKQHSQIQIQINEDIVQLVKLGKKQKQQLEKQQLENLSANLASLQIQSRQTQEKLNLRIKQLQSEKKTLVLGFQQIKTFLQNKESSYREEIQKLKQTINDLIQASEMRQKQFQEEIRLLSSQIESISSRYYDNIEFPLHKMNDKVQRQMQRVKEELTKISKQNILGEILQQLGQKLPNFFQKFKQQEQQQHAIELCLEKGNQLLATIRQLIQQMNLKKVSNAQRSSQSRSQQKSNPRSSNKRQLFALQQPDEPLFNNVQKQQSEIIQMNELKEAVSQIQLKQQQNKQAYEVNLLKKHNQKLNDHIAALQKKLRALPPNKMLDQKSMSTYFKTERKVVDLQSENQHLKQVNKQYEALLKQEVEKVYTKFNTLSKIVKTTKSQQSAIVEAINQLSERHDIVYELIKMRRERLEELQKSINIINNMLIKPAQSFQNLVREVAQMSNNHFLTQKQFNASNSAGKNQHFNSAAFSGSSYRSRLSINQNTIREYQQILSKRSDINNNGSRQIVELIKTLRQTFPVRQNKRRQNESSIHEKDNNLNKTTMKSKSGNFSFQFEKKIKEVQSLQLKYKSQISFKLSKISESIQGLQTKKQKKQKISENRQKKMQLLIEKHFISIITEIKHSIQKQTKQTGHISLPAWKDVQSKLKESIKENEGLKKQIEVLLLVNKTQSANYQNQQKQSMQSIFHENFNFFQKSS